MVGFDMGPLDNNGYNNYYANTEFYRTSDARPIYTGNWVKQIKSIALKNPTKQFIRVLGVETAVVSEFDSVRNIQNLPMLAFLECINNSKDF